MICLNLQFDGIRRKSHRQNAIFKKFIMIPFFYKCQLFVMFFIFHIISLPVLILR